jgi:3-dehydroquinate dehydratase/shikimate dehydrogenase
VRKTLFPDRICAVLAAATPRHLARQLRAARRLTRTFELRLDWLARTQDTKAALALLARGRQTWIATARRTSAGGRLRGSVHRQLDVLAKTVRRCAWRDVEVETMEPHGAAARAAGRSRLITSWHDFRRTPRDLQGVLRRLQHCGGDASKVAVQCNSIADSLRVLALCQGRRDVIAVPMGEMGLPARVLALQHGSALAYAAAGEKTAPGQLTLEEMKRLYRADKIDRRTRVYGVIGNPVSHSLSPLLHNTGFIACGLPHVYLPFLVRDLRDFLRAIGPLAIRGFSVTLPFKEAILRQLDDCDPLAAAIGAVNTVSVDRSGRLHGINTDYVGVLRALQRRIRLRGSRVLLLGAGGAARAAAFALAQEGAIPAICARRPERARALARAVHGEAMERRHLRREFFDAIVNCTPVGMHPTAAVSPLRTEELNCRLVFDTVYRPLETRLLKLARRRGIETVSGVEMFLAQGMAQWEIWNEHRAPEKHMRRAVLAALRKEANRVGKQKEAPLPGLQ